MGGGRRGGREQGARGVSEDEVNWSSDEQESETWNSLHDIREEAGDDVRSRKTAFEADVEFPNVEMSFCGAPADLLQLSNLLFFNQTLVKVVRVPAKKR
eukprot:560572-Hanusia_phi.AAC.1